MVKSSKIGKKNLSGRQLKNKNIVRQNGKYTIAKSLHRNANMQAWMYLSAKMTSIIGEDDLPDMNLTLLNKPIAALY